MPVSVGTRFGAYEVAALIGVGGMGEVYRATDPILKRSVALKVLSESFVGDEDRVARLEREAQTLAAVNHGNIAHIYGLERSAGTAALVMELVEGQTLAERIAEGRIPVEEALRIAMQIADALEAAHERGVIHRDLKPANIKIRSDGGVKVLDFGIAKALDTATTAAGSAGLTTLPRTTGVVLGTAAYMSPEQARGKVTDERTDIWSFACVLYEMLTGRPAFAGEDITSTLAQVLERAPDLRLLPASVPPAVRRTLELCFEKNPRKRLRHIADVRLVLGGRLVTDAPPRPRWRVAAAAASLAAAALLVGAYLESLRSNSERGARAVPTAAPIARFLITPPAGESIASQSGVDLAISQDGKRVAFYTQRVGANNVQIHVRDLDAIEVRPVPESALGYSLGGDAFFSFDGTAVAHYRGDGRLYVAAIDGRPLTALEERMGGFGGGWWAADNTIIRSSGGGLTRHSVADGTSAPLMPARDGLVATPVLLPDGHAVLFHASVAGVDRVEGLDLETGEVKTIVEAASNPAYVDTGHLVFARGDTLMAAPFDAARLAVTGEAVSLVRGIRRAAGGAADYVISRNGTLAYVPGTVVGNRAAVVWVDRGGNVLGRAVPEPVPRPRDPRLSPDGTRLLLVIGEDDGQLWSYDLRGRPPIPLAIQSDNSLPVWSPDGQQVAFVVGLQAESGAVVTLRADGSEATPQVLRASELAGAIPSWWAPSELMLIRFTGGQSSQPDIVGVPAAPNGAIRNVVATEAFEFDPALSPDGRWLAYTSTRTGRAEVWVQGYPDGTPIRVSSDGGYEPLWSADGRELFFLQGTAVMSAAVEAASEFSFAPPKPLFSGAYAWFPTGRAVSYDVARDGRFVMILPEEPSREAASDGVVVVLNFGEELKQRVRPSR